MTDQPHEAPPPFASESEMRRHVERAAVALMCDSTETWCVFEQQSLGNRIADVVLARIDVEAMRQRQLCFPKRALSPLEIRTAHLARTDRPISRTTLSRHLRVSQRSANAAIASLTKAGVFELRQTDRAQLRHQLPKVFTRLVSIEVKLADASKALIQARQHSLSVDSANVYFDGAFRSRFAGKIEGFVKSGIGLVAVTNGSPRPEVLAQSVRNRHFTRTSKAVSGERLIATLLATDVRPLPESRLPNASALNARQSGPWILGPDSNSARQLIAGW